MAEHADESIPRGVTESIRRKLEGGSPDRDSSSSDSDDGKSEPSPVSAKDRINRLFGREKPVHQVFGGGKTADVILWRNKKISAGFLVVATVIWILFELMGYHLLTLLSYGLIFTVAIMFLWSNAISFLNKSPPHLREVTIPEDLAVNVALSLRNDINKFFDSLRDIVVGRDLKKFLTVIAGLWVLSVLSSSVSFLTLFYIATILLHTVPVLYEKYDDKIDMYWEKAMAEVKKHCGAIQEAVVTKTRAAQSKFKKQQ